jgi:acetoin utilization protein AcuC
MEELLQAHSREFIEITDRLSVGEHVPSHRRYGFGSQDNPIFPGMYEASLTYCGASLDAARAILDGCDRAVNLSGGLHHAHYDRAAGFCTFNDCVLAIRLLRQKYDRVAYVDIDVHHGDGVQEAFYDDPSVLTISIHQTGRTLFPGTGFPEESGDGQGRRFAVNIPLWPTTDGDTWLRVWREIGLKRLKAFQPEAIVLQMGTDAHFSDPLADLNVTSAEWIAAVRDVLELGTPVVALGGGGYNSTVVPRLWTLAMDSLFDLHLPDEIPSSFPCRELGESLSDAIYPEAQEHHAEKAISCAAETITICKKVFGDMLEVNADKTCKTR